MGQPLIPNNNKTSCCSSSYNRADGQHLRRLKQEDSDRNFSIDSSYEYTKKARLLCSKITAPSYGFFVRTQTSVHCTSPVVYTRQTKTAWSNNKTRVANKKSIIIRDAKKSYVTIRHEMVRRNHSSTYSKPS